MDTPLPVTGNFEGILPIRVLQHNITAKLEKAHSRVVEEAVELLKASKLNPGIDYVIGRDIARTPRANCENRRIELQETFLASQWCIAYFFLTIHDWFASQYSVGNKPLAVDTTNPNIQVAHRLVEWGCSLYKEWSAWPDHLPNPEKFRPSKKEYIGKVNRLFLEGIVFILGHELGHFALDHCETITEIKSRPQWSEDDSSVLKSLEHEADGYAREFIFRDSDADTDQELCTKLFGALSGLLGILLSYPSVKAIRNSTHPDIDHRILNTLEYGLGLIGDEELRGAVRWEVVIGFRYFLTFNRIKPGGCVEYETIGDLLDECLRQIEDNK